MLTAVIRADDSARALAATLSILIPAVAEGFLGHAVIVDAAGAPEIESIADTTGASYLHASPAEAWRQGAAAARGEWLLLLDAGDVPQAHWAQVVERHLLIAPERPALLPLRSAAGSLRERAAISFGARRLRAGLVVPKAAVLAGRLGRPPQRLSVRRDRADP
ncbi:glycosyltransferase family 2 protein [Bosea sp. BH3]|uniref:glycosyltransferase family 2 protein n=1 Tax=Bosea sp. BH3 TaxID=2871701 RepID=UPI0021CB2903|nr:glycosyltransferase family A protein [Bosea sp. BH3]MCU4179038.1 glycosyltransferase family 2 protein [Bosea sp. BH3]